MDSCCFRVFLKYAKLRTTCCLLSTAFPAKARFYPNAAAFECLFPESISLLSTNHSDTTRFTMAILSTILVGLVVGAIAKLLMPGKDPGGFIVTILLGIAGALIATYLGQAVGWYRGRTTSGLRISVGSSVPSSCCCSIGCFSSANSSILLSR